MANEPMKRKLLTKKVLVAAVGIGAVSYVIACGDTTNTSGNLMAPDASTPKDGATDDALVSSGNLMAPDTGAIDAKSDAPEDANVSDVISSGNLMPPIDAGSDSSDSGGD